MASVFFRSYLELLRPEPKAPGYTRPEQPAEEVDAVFYSVGASAEKPQDSLSSTRCPSGSSTSGVASQRASLSSSPESAGGDRGARSITQMSEADFYSRYVLVRQVMKSGHRGINVLFSRRTSDDQIVVVKAYKKDTAFSDDDQEFKWRETMDAQLSLPKCDLICDFIEVVETEKRYYAVMEKVDGQDLWAWKARDGVRFKQDVIREITKQILQGVSVMHRPGRVHKDLKRENVMVSVDQQRLDNSMGVTVKLIDFDTAEAFQEGSLPATEVSGTQGYIAPEVYLGHSSPASDMFSVGVILYKLLTDHFPFPQLHEMKLDDVLVGSACNTGLHECLMGVQVDFSLPHFDAFPAAAALCRSLLERSPEMRPSAQAALQHAWFSQSA